MLKHINEKKTASQIHVAPRIVVHCCPLLPIVAHCCPFLSIDAHCCPLLPIVAPLLPMPHTATDWPKCFCIYRLKCSKAISGWLEMSDCTYSKSTCGAKNGITDACSTAGCDRQVVAKWSPSGHLVVTKWSPSSFQVVSKQSPSGRQVVTKSSPSSH